MIRAGLALGALVLVAGCATVNISDEEDALLVEPIDCDRAPEQIAALVAIRPTGERETMAGVSIAGPVGLAGAAVTGNLRDRGRLAGGGFRQEIDARIREIATTCNIDVEFRAPA